MAKRAIGTQIDMRLNLTDPSPAFRSVACLGRFGNDKPPENPSGAGPVDIQTLHPATASAGMTVSHRRLGAVSATADRTPCKAAGGEQIVRPVEGPQQSLSMHTDLGYNRDRSAHVVALSVTALARPCGSSLSATPAP